MEEPQAVLFDLDGTLRDSLVEVHRGVVNVCEKERVVAPTFDCFRREFSLPGDAYWRGLGVDRDYDSILVDWRASCDINGAPLFDDAVPTLEHFHMRSIPMGLISGHLDSEVQEYVRTHTLTKYFEIVTGSAAHKAPHIEKFVAEHSLAPERVWYVGDFVSDMRDAKEAGVVGIGITRGGEYGPELRAAGAMKVVETLHELQM